MSLDLDSVDLDELTMQVDTDLGTGLRRARLAAGIGLREAARTSPLNMTSIWRIEHGSMSPTVRLLRDLCSLYGADINIGRDGVIVTWLGRASDAVDDELGRKRKEKKA